MLELIRETKETVDRDLAFHTPSFIDISEESEEVWRHLICGIEALDQMAEMIPLGGAADRLHLIDEKTGDELPAAKLFFAGRSLLSTMIRDLQAREYLHYKLYGKQITTPLALMTSEEKENHSHVRKLLAENNWFGRPQKASACLFNLWFRLSVKVASGAGLPP